MRLAEVLVDYDRVTVDAYLFPSLVRYGILSLLSSSLFCLGAMELSLDLVECVDSSSLGVSGKKTEINVLLHQAARAGDIKLCESLIEGGADVNSVFQGATILHAAAKGGCGAVVQMLLANHKDKLDKNAQDIFGNTPLLVALKSYTVAEVFGCFISIREGLEINIREDRLQKVNTTGRKGFENIKKQSLEKVYDDEDRLEKVYYLDQRDLALIALKERCYDEVISLFIAAGCDISISNRKGRDALYYALKKNKLKALSLLMGTLRSSDRMGIMRSLRAAGERDQPDFDYSDLAVEACYRSCEDLVELIISRSKMGDVRALIDRKNLLHVAIENHNIRLTRYLVSCGASINKKGTLDCTPLHCAAIANKKDIAQFLLDNKAHIDAKDMRKNTPLYGAAASGNAAIVQLLVKRGANLFLKNSDGMNPLHAASQGGFVEIVEIVHAGFKEDASQSLTLWREPETLKASNAGNHPLMASARKIESVKDNHQNDHLRVACNKGMTSLHYAVLSKNNAAVELLISLEALVDASDGEGNTPLHLACVIGNFFIVKALLKAGGSVHARNKKGFTPLMCVSGHREGEKNDDELIEIINLLLECKADVNVVANNVWTPLLLAASAQNKKIAKKIRDSGAKLDAVNNEGLSLIHIAIQKGGAFCSQTVKILAEMETLKVDYAVVQSSYDNISCLNKLRSNQFFTVSPFTVTPSFFWAVDRGMKDVVEVLLETGIDINMRDRNGWTPLHRAVDTPTDTALKIETPEKLIILLLDRGALIDAVDDQAMTPLHIACRNLEITLIKLLLEKGSNVKRVAKNGYSCLHFVFFNVNPVLRQRGSQRASLRSSFDKGSDQNVTPIVKLLIKGGCDIDSVSSDRSTPLHWAVRAGLRSPVMALLGAGAKIDAKNVQEKTPLDEALENGDTELADLLRMGHSCSKNCTENLCKDTALEAIYGQNNSKESNKDWKSLFK